MSIFDNYINGEWVSGAGTVANVNPSDTSDIVGEYAQADAAQAETAMAAAATAFSGWSHSGIQQRFDSLDFIEKAVDRLSIFLLRIEGIIGLGD